MACRQRSSPVESPLLASRSEWEIDLRPLCTGALARNLHAPRIHPVGCLVSLTIKSVINPPIGLLDTDLKVHRRPFVSVAQIHQVAFVLPKSVATAPGESEGVSLALGGFIFRLKRDRRRDGWHWAGRLCRWGGRSGCRRSASSGRRRRRSTRRFGRRGPCRRRRKGWYWRRTWLRRVRQCGRRRRCDGRRERWCQARHLNQNRHVTGHSLHSAYRLGRPETFQLLQQP